MGKTTGYVIGMFVLGSVLLAGVGWLVHVRMERRPPTAQPFRESVGTSGSDSGNRGLAHVGAGNISALGHGLAASINAAVNALNEGRRADANVSLDAARRASQVGEAASGDRITDLFRRASAAINQARHSIQNGQPELAAPPLRAVIEPLESVPASTASAAPDPVESFEGATVIDTRGFVIGEIDGFAMENGDRVALVRRGGWCDFMGLFNIGGDRVPVSTSELMFGQPRRIGSTLVALSEMR